MEDDEDLLGTGGMVRTMASMSAYTGADDMVYKEYRRVNTAPAAKYVHCFSRVSFFLFGEEELCGQGRGKG